MPREDGNGYLRKTSEVRKDGMLKGLMNRIRKEKNAALHNCLIIGLDFGTTYSGASWVTVADFENEDINIITQWPGTTHEEAKTPTRLYYEYGNDTPLWGFQVQNDVEAIEWFKLLLLRDDDMWDELRASDQIMRAKRMIRESEKTPVECVSQYLRALWEHTLKTILKARRKYLIDSLQFHVVLTVPAIWKDYARKEMEEAARKAGILDYRRAGPTTLTFAPEPEAAGLAALIERGSKVNPEDVYVICDAGGGTVDVITYRVGDIMPLRLHEAVEGAGDVCGGIFIDEDFTVQLKNRIGRKWASFSQVQIKSILEAEWEYAIKTRYFQNSGRTEYPVCVLKGPLSASELNDTSRKPHIKNGYIHFSNSDIREVFNKRAVPGLVKLVDTQIRKAQGKGLNVTGIVLVGGLGSSPYIYEHLEAKYTKHGIEICQSVPDRTRTAICRGAILKGLMDAPIAVSIPDTPSVLSTISRTSLGVTCSHIFVEGVHKKKDKYWDEKEGVWRAGKQMDWYLKKGEDVAKEHPIQKTYYRLYSNRDEFNSSSLTESIYQNVGNTPPLRRNDDVTELCKIKFSLDGCDYDSLDNFKGAKGRMLKQFNYMIQMVPSGASTEFAIFFQDEKVGSEHVKIQYQEFEP